jgi:hypothetical protein
MHDMQLRLSYGQPGRTASTLRLGGSALRCTLANKHAKTAIDLIEADSRFRVTDHRQSFQVPVLQPLAEVAMLAVLARDVGFHRFHFPIR